MRLAASSSLRRVSRVRSAWRELRCAAAKGRLRLRFAVALLIGFARLDKHTCVYVSYSGVVHDASLKCKLGGRDWSLASTSKRSRTGAPADPEESSGPHANRAFSFLPPADGDVGPHPCRVRADRRVFGRADDAVDGLEPGQRGRGLPGQRELWAGDRTADRTIAGSGVAAR